MQSILNWLKGAQTDPNYVPRLSNAVGLWRRAGNRKRRRLISLRLLRSWHHLKYDGVSVAEIIAVLATLSSYGFARWFLVVSVEVWPSVIRRFLVVFVAAIHATKSLPAAANEHSLYFPVSAYLNLRIDER